jgi:hypothetical protein
MNRCVSLSAGPLMVQFQPFGDRLSHTIGMHNGNKMTSILESIEGSSADAWPVSPPMQQMVSESVGNENAPVLFGVGLSGNGHWSMAIDTREDRWLNLDIACKNSKSATRLGSEYRVGPEVECWQEEDSLKLVCNDSVIAVVMRVVLGEMHWDALERRIVLRPSSSIATAQTHRWCFRLGIEAS